ncbi:rhomboid family intramembrane serine protease [Pontibacter sp. SGAir0037]|uniref:rhomboid family intramembrane serine protease n=1 Tax=Pontibacter sp. SGAir0037 TaxID=2571030 RepID=UPI0010CCF5C2|nr:rhomboid family intramembrane serine protease [Pontibacter sp. SGAir0037]QCR22958.1 rhomboid family intramembrane serine protease [Pontibacter sp. SGAir0037]
MKEENSRFAYSFLPGTLFVLLLCLISFLTYLTDADLVWLGVLPRHFFGLIGIVTGPLVHSGLTHLLSNAFPLVLLSGFILFQYRKTAGQVFLLVYVLSGVLTWFIGRQAYHIGASGVVYGLAGFLLFNGLIRRDRGSWAVSLAVLFLYGGLFYGLFPNEERISWEGHIGGMIAGLVASLATDSRQKTTPAGEPDEPASKLNLNHPHLSSTLGAAYNNIHIIYTITSSSEKPKVIYAGSAGPEENTTTNIITPASPPAS